MSIASRVNTEFHDDDFSKGLLLMEATATEHLVGVIIGDRPEVARELAHLILVIERGIALRRLDDINKTINTMDLLVELAYLESKEYSQSLQDWRLELSGGKVPESNAAATEEV